MDKETCATCKFFTETHRWDKDEPAIGVCKRHAPVRTNSGTDFPGVHSELWCGDYVKLEEGEK